MNEMMEQCCGGDGKPDVNMMKHFNVPMPGNYLVPGLLWGWQQQSCHGSLILLDLVGASLGLERRRVRGLSSPRPLPILAVGWA